MDAADPARIAPGSPGSALWDPEAVPAATVVVLRDGTDGLEVLMLQRDQGLSFAGGMWVFPGGRLDPGDWPGGATPEDPSPEEFEIAARHAAVREAREESGLDVDEAALRRWSHWTPPPRADKRFTTAFFVAPATDATAEVVIDDGEIRAHRWARPGDVIALRDAGEITLAPPTYITLFQLLGHDTVAEAMAAAHDRAVEHFATRIAVVGEQWVALYHGDVAYEHEEPDAEAPGPRHRLYMDATWSYVREL
jgi:8-oxo-dGTP pyrophosphatase MutT (NUDIX family)